MGTELLIKHIRAEWFNWIVLIFIAVSSGYFFFMFIMYHIQLANVKKRKKTLEEELDALNAQLEKQTKELEEELNRKDEILKKGKG